MALMLMLDVPLFIQQIRSKYDSHRKVPAHVTLGYLDKINEEWIKELSTINEITFDSIKISKDIIALIPCKEDILHLKKLTGFIKVYPKSGFHLTLAYEYSGLKKLDKITEIIQEIKLPITVKVSSVSF